MKKLAKYLKPFLLGLLFAVALLFLQSMCDLNLPNYMSDIVNVGIQQGGIEEGIPTAISENGYRFMSTFMTAEDLMLFTSAYEPISESEDFEAIEKTFPLAGEKAAYILKKADLPVETIEKLEKAFGTAVWTMIYFQQEQVHTAPPAGMEFPADADVPPDMVASGEDAEVQTLESIDITKAYELLPMLSQLPSDAFADARRQAFDLDPMVREQSGSRLVAMFYEELGADTAMIQRDYIIHVGLLMLLIALLSGIATVLVSLLSSRIAAGVAKNMRHDIFAKVSQFSGAEYDKFSTSTLITRSTNDITQVQMLLTMGIRMICYAPIMGIGGILMALKQSVSMGWIIALAVGFIFLLIAVVLIVALPKFTAMQKFIDRLNLVARETLNGLMVIRAFGTSGFEKKRFDGANKDLAKNTLFVNRTMTFIMPIMMFFMNGLSILIIWVGSHQVAQSQMQVGDMMAFMQYAMQIMMSFMMIAMMFIFIPRAMVSLTRIAEVLDTEPTILDPESPVSIADTHRGKIELKNVSFRYQGADDDALTDISFAANPAETTAIIGSTGSGKSTLLNLIPRFYDATSGEVLLDGVNVAALSQKELRSYIGYVPQKSVLMSGTIASNIAYGSEALSAADMQLAAKVAQAEDFITEKAEGFDAPIAQGGGNVSGGQKQRLSIARALAVKPDVFLFDDSFSALDFKTDAALRKALSETTKGSTVIIVAQRVSTILHADRIYVLDDGRIVGEGTHKELLSSCKEYYEIASSQLSKEELENV